MAFLEINQLHKSYGPVDVLKGINIAIEEGGFLVLVGPSGCGKSTLLNTIAGLEDITSGAIKIDGSVVNDLHPSKRDIAMVFQSYALYPSMNVRDNIAFGLEMRGASKEERADAVAGVADMLQIGHLLDRRPGQLSGGQRQRVAMGRALVRDPKLFLFDEPLSNLDAKLRVDMRTEIKRLHQKLSATIVYVTHDQIEAMTLATQIAVLKDGVLQQVGSPDEVYNTPANLFVADFMGSPTMNLIPAKLEKNDAGVHVELSRESGSIILPVREKAGALDKLIGKNIVFGIRPEDVTDAEGQDAAATDVAQAECHVEVVEPTGADKYVVTHLGGKELIARMRAGFGVNPGDKMPFNFNMGKAHFFDPASEMRVA
ncbi:MAG: ABC transporter ATP-binding protein [Alphaproteobacteria bacterium]|nr:ABC transporter ATP-binding protein [Alphaproteobacteria bacterium]